MPEDLVGDPPYYTTPIGTNSTVYHAHADCIRIAAPEKVTERSETFIAWHELDPCRWCHDELDPQNNPGEYGHSPAKEIRYGGGSDA